MSRTDGMHADAHEPNVDDPCRRRLQNLLESRKQELEKQRQRYEQASQEAAASRARRVRGQGICHCVVRRTRMPTARTAVHIFADSTHGARLQDAQNMRLLEVKQQRANLELEVEALRASMLPTACQRRCRNRRRRCRGRHRVCKPDVLLCRHAQMRVWSSPPHFAQRGPHVRMMQSGSCKAERCIMSAGGRSRSGRRFRPASTGCARTLRRRTSGCAASRLSWRSIWASRTLTCRTSRRRAAR